MNPPQNLRDLIFIFIDLINTALPVIAGLALLVFLWGLVKFISKSGDSKNHAEGRSLMIWGIIALFVMVSFMGLIALLHYDLGFGSRVGLPLLPPNSSLPR